MAPAAGVQQLPGPVRGDPQEDTWTAAEDQTHPADKQEWYRNYYTYSKFKLGKSKIKKNWVIMASQISGSNPEISLSSNP